MFSTSNVLQIQAFRYCIPLVTCCLFWTTRLTFMSVYYILQVKNVITKKGNLMAKIRSALNSALEKYAVIFRAVSLDEAVM